MNDSVPSLILDGRYAEPGGPGLRIDGSLYAGFVSMDQRFVISDQQPVTVDQRDEWDHQ